MALKDEGEIGKSDDSLSMRFTCYGIRKKFPRVQQLSTEQFASWLDENKTVTLLDTRPEHEYKVSRLAGATRIDPDDLESSLPVAEHAISGTPPDQPVVLYCSVGYRSCMVADKLIRRAQSNEAIKRPIYNLEGSIFKWANENRPVIDSEGAATHFVHPFNSFFGKLLESSRRFNSSL